MLKKQNNMNEIVTFIKQHKTFAIVAHLNPDGDALGSAYALAQAINNLGKSAEVVLLCEPPYKYAFDIFQPLYKIHSETDYSNYDAFIAVDCATLARLGQIKDVFVTKPNANIDHHISNERFAKVNYVQEAAATGEIIYRLTKQLGVEPDKLINMAVYIAIATDTGNFTYGNTSASTLDVFCSIVSSGMPLPEVADRVFNSRSLGATKLIARFIETMRFYYDDRVCIGVLMLEDIERTGAKIEDCEDIINYARNVETVECAVFIREMHENVYKVSLRSKDYVDVADFAGRFDGGGHIRAAGCKMHGNIHDIMQNIIKIAGEYLQ